MYWDMREEFNLINQDTESEEQMDVSTRQWPQTYSQNNSRPLSKKEVKMPAYLLTMNPTEHLERILKLRAYQRDPGNLEELRTVCQEEWAKTEPQKRELLATVDVSKLQLPKTVLVQI